MERLPLRIDPCPITEAVYEIRYQTNTPSDAIFGILYSFVSKYFTEPIISLPILQIPEPFRSQNQDMMYQPYYRLSDKNKSFSIGPRVLTFSNAKPYLGWEEWEPFIEKIMSDIQKAGIIQKVERTGLRYINLFDGNVLSKIELGIKLKDKVIIDESTTFRTEIMDEGIIKILQIGSAVLITSMGAEKLGSLIDIDCIKNLCVDAEKYFSEYKESLNFAHKKEKELFFNLLKPDFLASLKPSYEE